MKIKNPFKKEEKVESPVVEIVETVGVIEDRSAFNCSNCKGDGLIAQGTKDVICPSCLGTGKV